MTRDIFPTSYSVGWYELPAGLGVGEGVATVRAAWLHGLTPGMKVVERPATLAGEAGTEIATENTLEGLTVHFLMRTCVHKGRIYAAYLFGRLDAASEETWTRLLDSFRFTP